MIATQRHTTQIRSLLLNGSEFQWNMAMTWRRNSYLSEAAQAWLALVREVHVDN